MYVYTDFSDQGPCRIPLEIFGLMMRRSIVTVSVLYLMLDWCKIAMFWDLYYHRRHVNDTCREVL